jgi:hypothetical protein
LLAVSGDLAPGLLSIQSFVLVLFLFENAGDENGDELEDEKDKARQHQLYCQLWNVTARLVYSRDGERIETQELVDVPLIHHQAGEKESNGDEDEKIDNSKELEAPCGFWLFMYTHFFSPRIKLALNDMAWPKGIMGGVSRYEVHASPLSSNH